MNPRSYVYVKLLVKLTAHEERDIQLLRTRLDPSQDLRGARFLTILGKTENLGGSYLARRVRMGNNPPN